MERIRPAAVAGSFYPSETGELNTLLDHCFVSSPLGPQGVRSPSSSLLGGLVPHAGFVYSGPCAAHLYARFDHAVERVILIGVNHRGGGHKAALSPADFWETPLGRVPVDQETNAFLEEQAGFLKTDERAHFQEHSIEVQLPFLQMVAGNFTFVPISLSYVSTEECARLGEAIAVVLTTGPNVRKRTVILASSDLSHYLSPQKTEALDRAALEKVLALDGLGLLNVVEEDNITMCGVFPTAVLLFAARALGSSRARLLKHCHSGDVAPMREVVGYASVALEL